MKGSVIDNREGMGADAVRRLREATDNLDGLGGAFRIIQNAAHAHIDLRVQLQALDEIEGDVRAAYLDLERELGLIDDVPPEGFTAPVELPRKLWYEAERDYDADAGEPPYRVFEPETGRTVARGLTASDAAMLAYSPEVTRQFIALCIMIDTNPALIFGGKTKETFDNVRCEVHALRAEFSLGAPAAGAEWERLVAEARETADVPLTDEEAAERAREMQQMEGSD